MRVSRTAGMVLAANPQLPRFALPATYNYAFRRDRERLPPPLSRRLRHGMFGQAAINIHFVMDGKPWQRQNLSTYPMWPLGACTRSTCGTSLRRLSSRACKTFT